MNKYLLIITILLSVSCIRKKIRPPKIKQSAALLKVSIGAFTTDNKFFYSDGIDLYCQFSNVEEAKTLLKKKENGFAFMDAESEPIYMKFAGKCNETLLKD